MLQTQALYVGFAMLSSQKAQCQHQLASASSPGTTSSIVLFRRDQMVILSPCVVCEACSLENFFYFFISVGGYSFCLCMYVFVCLCIFVYL